MPTVEGREARVWIDEYVKKAGKLSGVAKMVRALVKKAVAGCEAHRLLSVNRLQSGNFRGQ